MTLQIIPTLTQLDTAAKFKIGQRYLDDKGNEYIYLVGVASVVLGDWCHYHVVSNSSNTVVRAVANGIGQLAIAMAAIVASTYGWFQVKGFNAECGAISGGDAAAGSVPYLTATAGLVDDVVVVGDRVDGATIEVQEDSALAGVMLNYPGTTNASN